MVERSQGVATSKGNLLQVAYQKTRELITFSARDLANQVVDGEKTLVCHCILRSLVDQKGLSGY